MKFIFSYKLHISLGRHLIILVEYLLYLSTEKVLTRSLCSSTQRLSSREEDVEKLAPAQEAKVWVGWGMGQQ